MSEQAQEAQVIDWSSDEAVVKARWPNASDACPLTHGKGKHIHIGQPFSQHNYAGHTWAEARQLVSVQAFERAHRLAQPQEASAQPTRPHCDLCTKGVGDHLAPTIEHPEPVRTVREVISVDAGFEDGPLSIERVYIQEVSAQGEVRHCPSCGGTGWMKGFDGDKTECPHCRGYGAPLPSIPEGATEAAKEAASNGHSHSHSEPESHAGVRGPVSNGSSNGDGGSIHSAGFIAGRNHRSQIAIPEGATVKGADKPWRKHVFPAGPWRLQWYGSGADRGYWIKEGRDTIAFLGEDFPSDDAQDIVWAHNVAMLAQPPAPIESGSETFKTYIWRDRLKFVAFAHARSVKEARELLEAEGAFGDASTPVRQEMGAFVRERNPEIFYREVAEAILTDSGELEDTELAYERCREELKTAKALPAPLASGEPFDPEEVWEKHSQLIETIECDMRGEEALMKRSDFMRAVEQMRQARSLYRTSGERCVCGHDKIDHSPATMQCMIAHNREHCSCNNYRPARPSADTEKEER